VPRSGTPKEAWRNTPAQLTHGGIRMAPESPTRPPPTDYSVLCIVFSESMSAIACSRKVKRYCLRSEVREHVLSTGLEYERVKCTALALFAAKLHSLFCIGLFLC
jgi:hypothetical protein